MHEALTPAISEGESGRVGEWESRGTRGRMAGGLRRRLAVALAEDVRAFGRWGQLPALRPYQLEVTRAVARSVIEGQGLTFTVLFPRQAGKNELSAQLEAFLLHRWSLRGGSMVTAAPTFRPQILTSRLRLERMLEGRPRRTRTGCWRGRTRGGTRRC
jgi:hypothetical protein